MTTTIIDGSGHIMGRLASVIAKQLLSGNRVIVVRCEEIIIVGPWSRTREKYCQWKRKRTSVRPNHGPFHYREPSRIFWKSVRGMLPHKTFRGTAALKRLKVFEGIPAPYDKRQRVVVPEALKVLKVKPFRKSTKLGRLSHEFGWKHSELVGELEKKRKARAKNYFLQKTARKKIVEQAFENKKKELEKLDPILKQFGCL
ncbi:60S ribosomal protein L13A-RELATED [Anaeramoeba flamelloides]|uniref:60S ribosomal protein L13A-RELATED n=1 Tax=Anaeramoeba flamelloides TaxID=1746091 RepID=A0AAV7YP52_9EUKA|nr:60S ribosomal protein L13A-RELATED [Anaeramoeba flamelloides]KAJ6252482.1 60S ribosomal protein L13A-RELATED [Anaeramoeba flamelloides]